MTVEAILGIVFFVGLFVAWVIVPTQLRKRHIAVEEDKNAE